MLSLLCNVEFGEEHAIRRHPSYAALSANKHNDVLITSPLFTAFVEKLASTANKQTTSNEPLTVSSWSELKEANELDATCVAIASLQAFVQANWLGPAPCEASKLPAALAAAQDAESEKELSSRVFNLTDHFKIDSPERNSLFDKLRQELGVDGETLFTIVKCPHLLLLSKLILLDCREAIGAHVPLVDWWALRLIGVYQNLFEERTATLTSLSASLIEKLNAYFDRSHEKCLLTSYEEPVFKFATICYNLETGHFNFQNYNWMASQVCFKKALELSSLTFEMTGIRGKRTKFQQNDLAQLFLKVNKVTTAETTAQVDQVKPETNGTEHTQWTYANSELDPKLMPKNLALNDDTLLDKVKISDPQDEQQLATTDQLSQLDSVVLFCVLFDYQKNNPQHVLTTEEMSSFIEFLLTWPKNWCVQFCLLFMRAKLEVSSTRRMERSLNQLENLLDCYRHPQELPEAAYRLPFFYCVNSPSFWTLQNELAKVYMQLGLINSSLEIYLALENWDEVIKCYQTLDKRDKAETLIRQRLSVKETPDLYCSLGEVTGDTEHFDKAIVLSKGRSARAYRMLAKYQFSKSNYADSIVNFEKSLEINSMQYNAWFMMGSAAFRTEKWETSIKAFKFCTTLDPENHESWNNLAASYIKLNKKDKAHDVFQEALKYDYENWKVWENYLWTSTDCGFFDDVIKAYHRLLDLKEKYVDVDVLKVLSTAVEKNMCDARDKSIYKLRASLLKLFGRLTSLSVNEWQVFWYYAEIVINLGRVEETNIELKKVELLREDAEKAFGLYQKAFRNLYNQPGWEVAVDSCRTVIVYATQLLSRCLELGSCLQSPRDTFGSFNFGVRSIISKLKKKYEVDPSLTGDQEEPNNNGVRVVKLLYLKELNDIFVDLQIEFHKFSQQFFSS